MNTLRRNLTDMTPLARSIVNDVRVHGPSTSGEIADRIGSTTRSVQNSCTWLRGYRWLSDGSTSTRIGDGLAHTPAPSPIKWRYITREEVVANLTSGRWLP